MSRRGSSKNRRKKKNGSSSRGAEGDQSHLHSSSSPTRRGAVDNDANQQHNRDIVFEPQQKQQSQPIQPSQQQQSPMPPQPFDSPVPRQRSPSRLLSASGMSLRSLATTISSLSVGTANNNNNNNTATAASTSPPFEQEKKKLKKSNCSMTAGDNNVDNTNNDNDDDFLLEDLSPKSSNSKSKMIQSAFRSWFAKQLDSSKKKVTANTGSGDGRQRQQHSRSSHTMPTDDNSVLDNQSSFSPRTSIMQHHANKQGGPSFEKEEGGGGEGTPSITSPKTPNVQEQSRERLSLVHRHRRRHQKKGRGIGGGGGGGSSVAASAATAPQLLYSNNKQQREMVTTSSTRHTTSRPNHNVRSTITSSKAATELPPPPPLRQHQSKATTATEAWKHHRSQLNFTTPKRKGTIKATEGRNSSPASAPPTSTTTFHHNQKQQLRKLRSLDDSSPGMKTSCTTTSTAPKRKIGNLHINVKDNNSDKSVRSYSRSRQTQHHHHHQQQQLNSAHHRSGGGSNDNNGPFRTYPKTTTTTCMQQPSQQKQSNSNNNQIPSLRDITVQRPGDFASSPALLEEGGGGGGSEWRNIRDINVTYEFSSSTLSSTPADKADDEEEDADILDDDDVEDEYDEEYEQEYDEEYSEAYDEGHNNGHNDIIAPAQITPGTLSRRPLLGGDSDEEEDDDEEEEVGWRIGNMDLGGSDNIEPPPLADNADDLPILPPPAAVRVVSGNRTALLRESEQRWNSGTNLSFPSDISPTPATRKSSTADDYHFEQQITATTTWPCIEKDADHHQYRHHGTGQRRFHSSLPRSVEEEQAALRLAMLQQHRVQNTSCPMLLDPKPIQSQIRTVEEEQVALRLAMLQQHRVQNTSCPMLVDQQTKRSNNRSATEGASAAAAARRYLHKPEQPWQQPERHSHKSAYATAGVGILAESGDEDEYDKDSRSEGGRAAAMAGTLASKLQYAGITPEQLDILRSLGLDITET